MASLSNIKKRINSIYTTSKITQAMKLVATAKLQRQKAEFIKISNYVEDLYDLIANLTKNSNFKDVFKTKNTTGKNLYVVMASSLGLCGAFNNNIAKHAVKLITKDDEVITVGTKAYSNLKMRGIEKQIVRQFEFSSNLNYLEVLPLSHLIVNEFKKSKYDKVIIVYTKFMNSLSFEPVNIQLLPFDASMFNQNTLKKPKDEELDETGKIIEFEPNHTEIINSTLPFFVASMIVACETESRLCEYSSRRNSMETASDNAKELINNLKLEYNQARQEKITQEINEIVAGANK